jgi:hypothetical protein
MTRFWDETAASVFDVIPGPLLLLLLLVVAGGGGALWYHYPAWIPHRRHRRHAPKAEPLVITASEPEPEQPPAELADRLAADGRYAEAIRQRLRDVIRDLVTAGALTPQPGWTAAELTAIAAAQRPGVALPLTAATALFSDIWYGARPAGPEQDDRMRTLTGQVRAELTPADA